MSSGGTYHEKYKMKNTPGDIEKNKELAERLVDDVKDKNNPRSLVNILPTSIAVQVRTIPQEYLDMPIKDLQRLVTPDPLLDRLRMSFWLEYNFAQASERNMNIGNITSGLMTQQQFSRSVCSNNLKLAYIIRPTGNYTATLEDLMIKAMDQLGEILALPLIRKQTVVDRRTGDVHEFEVVDTKLAQVKSQIARDVMIQARGYGVQRIDQRTQNTNINVETTSKDIMSIEEIEEKLKEVNERLGERTVQEVSDVEIETAPEKTD